MTKRQLSQASKKSRWILSRTVIEIRNIEWRCRRFFNTTQILKVLIRVIKKKI